MNYLIHLNTYWVAKSTDVQALLKIKVLASLSPYPATDSGEKNKINITKYFMVRIEHIAD